MESTETSLKLTQWPGPQSRLLTTWCVLKRPFKSYQRWRAQYGDTFTIKSLNGNVTASCDLDFIKDFIKLTSEEHKPFATQAAGPVFGMGSLLTLEGKRHARERKLLLPPFNGGRMKSYLSIIQSAAKERIACWSGDITLTDEVMPISLDIIIQVVFGARDPDRVKLYHELIRGFIGSFNPALIFSSRLHFSFFGLTPWDKFSKAKQVLKDELRQEVRGRTELNLGEDILSLLIQARYEDGEAMSEDDIVDELVTLLIAGHETSQITIAWAIYWLFKNPDKLTLLKAELKDVDDPSEILSASYLDGVVNETLRIDPIVPDVLRTLTVDKLLGGHFYPAGSHLAVVTALLHTREDLYEQPEAFRPERWLGTKPKPWSFFPFGGGARRCIGASLAIAEVKIVIAEVIKKWSIELLSDERSKRVNVVMAPAHGVRARIKQAK